MRTDQETIENILTVFGNGRVLYVGENPRMLDFFLRNGVDCKAICIIQSSGENTNSGEKSERITYTPHLSSEAMGAPGWADIIVVDDVLSAMHELQLQQKLVILRRHTSRYICLYLNATSFPEGHRRDRIWWEKQCIQAGFFRHPRSMVIAPYWMLNSDDNTFWVLMEKVPDEVLEEYSLDELEKHRILHMDMLREPSRRGDAHIVRYFMASSYIRPGDAVLDCACGLGYGSYILYANSQASKVTGVDFEKNAVKYACANYGRAGKIEFRQGDAQDLSFMPDNSVDFIAGFETIEHLKEPEKYLQELYRVLKPSGRVMLSAPDRWVDETGKDPNPHHFHVYTWDKLYQEVSAYFIPDKGFLQTAGGAMRLNSAIRDWWEIPCTEHNDTDAEWVLLLAMKTPLSGKDVPYEETSFPVIDDPDYHVGAFGRDYLNPWLVKGMVTIGFRLHNNAALSRLQLDVLEQYPATSADYGAALCGFAYRVLDSGVEYTEFNILEKINKYAAMLQVSPHVLRWQVSLVYAAGLICQARGKLEEAEHYFQQCVRYDVVPFSPLLGTKILGAYFKLSTFKAIAGELEEAQKNLVYALEEYKRLLHDSSWLNLVGNNVATPFSPGYAEMAQLADMASMCAYALCALNDARAKPGAYYANSKGWFERIILSHKGYIQYIEDVKSSQATSLVSYRSKEIWLENTLNEMRLQVSGLQEELSRIQSHKINLERELLQMQSHTVNLERELLQMQSHTVSLEGELHLLRPYGVINKIIPPGSLRRRILKMCLKPVANFLKN